MTGIALGLHADGVAGELAIRFLLGGALVSAFAAIGAVCEPKTLAGIFGSAPSVALVTLTLAFTTHGASYAATECASMAIGAVALVAYSLACAAVATRVGGPIWMGAAASWLVWSAVAFGLWALVA